MTGLTGFFPSPSLPLMTRAQLLLVVCTLPRCVTSIYLLDLFGLNVIEQSYKSKFKNNINGFVFRFAITLLIIVYIAKKLDWSELVRQLIMADPFWLMIACLLFGLVNLLAALRWWFLLLVQGIHLPVLTVTMITFIGQFFNSFLLGAIGGDIIKALYVQKYAPNHKTYATLSLIMDRAIGLMILIFGSLISMFWQFRNNAESSQISTIMYALLGIFSISSIVGLLLIFMPFQRFPARLRKLVDLVPHKHIFKLMISGFRQHGVALKLTLASMVMGIILTIVLIAACYSIAIAIGLGVTYLQMLIIMTVVICVVSLPISIGGHGVREGAFIIMFSAFGLVSIGQQMGKGGELVILFSLLFFTIPLFWSIVGGIIYLSFRHDYSLTVLKDI